MADCKGHIEIHPCSKGVKFTVFGFKTNGETTTSGVWLSLEEAKALSLALPQMMALAEAAGADLCQGKDHAPMFPLPDAHEHDLGPMGPNPEAPDRPPFVEGTRIEQGVRAIIEAQLEVNPDLVKMESSLIDDLHADDLAVVEVILAIEEMFGIEICDEDGEGVKTVQDAINLVERLQVVSHH